MTAVSLFRDKNITAMTSYHVPSSVRSAITSHNKWRMCKDEANTVVKFVSLELPYQVLHKRGGDILFLTHRCCVGFHSRFSLRLRKKRKTFSSLLTSDFGEINAREIRGTTSTRVKCSPNFALPIPIVVDLPYHFSIAGGIGTRFLCYICSPYDHILVS